MAIVDKIHDLTKKMTGQDGVGSDITTAINDLTAKWTQSAGKGSNIEESIANLSSNASSGGGGDFTTANITLSVTGTGQSDTYTVDAREGLDGEVYIGVYWDEEIGLTCESAEVNVNYDNPKTLTIYVLNNHYITVTTANADEEFTVTGNAEAYTDTSLGESYNAVKVYGDCTISVVGGTH